MTIRSVDGAEVDTKEQNLHYVSDLGGTIKISPTGVALGVSIHRASEDKDVEEER